MGAASVGRGRRSLRARVERDAGRRAPRRPARPAPHRRAPRPAAVASSLPSCVVVPELTEGPYYVNENLDRSDIRIDTSDGSVSEGAVLTLDWVVSQVDGNACIPLEGVLVDVWHCDALGQLLGRRQRAGPRLPAWLPAHRRERQGDDHDHLPGLVPGPRRPHPLQDPHRRGRDERLRVHVAAVLRRRLERAGLPSRRLRREGHARPVRTPATASTSRARA